MARYQDKMVSESMIGHQLLRSMKGWNMDMLDRMATDNVILHKANGTQIPNIKALIQTTNILIPDPSVPVEENDRIIRVLPNGLEERYLVKDRGFQAGMGGSGPHYQVKFEREFSSQSTLATKDSTDSRKVFVVHGRNLAARNSLFQFLRSIGLQPIEWIQAISMTGKASPFVGEILHIAFSKAQAVVVLFTGDDEAKLRDQFLSTNDPLHERALTPQARPNVLFEAGMAFGFYPDRTILVEFGNLRPFSDIAGRHVIHLNNSSESRQEIAQRLATAGCSVDLSGTDWHKAGDFEIATTT